MLLLLVWKIGISTFQFLLQYREKLLLFLLIIQFKESHFISCVETTWRSDGGEVNLPFPC